MLGIAQQFYFHSINSVSLCSRQKNLNFVNERFIVQKVLKIQNQSVVKLPELFFNTELKTTNCIFSQQQNDFIFNANTKNVSV